MSGYKSGTRAKDQLVLPHYNYGTYQCVVYVDLNGIENQGKESLVVNPNGVPAHLREGMTVEHIPFDMEAVLAYEQVRNKERKVYHFDRGTLEMVAAFNII